MKSNQSRPQSPSSFIRYKTVTILLTLLYFVKIITFFIHNPQFYYYWDWPGHIQKAQEMSWIPWQSGWSTTFWGGYPTLLYPNLCHYFIKAFLWLIPYNLFFALAIPTTLILILQTYSFYLAAKKLNSNPLFQLGTFAIMLVINLYSQPSMLGSIDGTLITGGLPATLASAFIFFYLSTNIWPIKAIFLGLTFLTHTLSAIVLLIIWAVEFGLKVFDLLRHRQSFSHSNLATSIFVPIGGLLIGSPWLLPLLDPAFSHSAVNIDGNYNSTSLTSFLLIVTLLALIHKRKLNQPIPISTLIILSLSLCPFPLARFLEQAHIIRGIHFYRLAWYSQLLLALTAPVFFPRSNTLSKITKKAFAFLITVLIITKNIIHQSHTLEFFPDKYSNLQGRVIDAVSDGGLQLFPRVVQHYLAMNSTLTPTVGLFYESSPLGVEYYTLNTAINPKVFLNGVYINWFKNKDMAPQTEININETADLLGINYYFSTTKKKPPVQDTITTIGRLYQPNQSDEQQAYIYLEKISDTQSVVTLNSLPLVQPTIDIGEWWLKTDHHQLVTDTELPNITNINLNQPPVTNLSVKPQTISFSINSQTPTPIHAKFTYNRYWQAQALDNQSFTTQPQWLTPGHMLLFSHGSIQLTWTPPPYLKLTYLISGLTTTLLLYHSTKNKKPSKKSPTAAHTHNN